MGAVSLCCLVPLLAGVGRTLVHSVVEGSAEVVEFAMVAEGAPLHVDAHATLVPLHQLHVLHLLHVARVCARAWEKVMCTDPHR